MLISFLFTIGEKVVKKLKYIIRGRKNIQK